MRSRRRKSHLYQVRQRQKRIPRGRRNQVSRHSALSEDHGQGRHRLRSQSLDGDGWQEQGWQGLIVGVRRSYRVRAQETLRLDQWLYKNIPSKEILNSLSFPSSNDMLRSSTNSDWSLNNSFIHPLTSCLYLSLSLILPFLHFTMKPKSSYKLIYVTQFWLTFFSLILINKILSAHMLCVKKISRKQSLTPSSRLLSRL